MFNCVSPSGQGCVLYFLLHAVCNRVQREVLGMVKNQHLDGFTSIFPDL
jgi:hypothetical protein